MKKHITGLFAIGTLFASNLMSAQDIDLQTPAQNLETQLKGVFPYVAVAIFVVVILVNLGHFVKEGGDWKKGLTNIVLFAIVLSIITGLVAYVGSIKL